MLGCTVGQPNTLNYKPIKKIDVKVPLIKICVKGFVNETTYLTLRTSSSAATSTPMSRSSVDP